jgi:lipopolysaccharide transport system ATP-binding protein
MSDVAIRVDGIGKRYRLGARTARYETIRERIAGFARNPVRALRRAPRETFWALKDVSFEVKPGEVIGVVGRNGAGKSTLLKILSRISEPTEGAADVHGRVGSLLEVGTGFHTELTGRENVFLNGAILGMKRAETARKFDEIVSFAQVERFIDTPVKFYSSGMYMRLAFAVAAHLEPEILIVDEVLAVGDAAFQKKCLGKMGDVARGGRTVLFVSHQMNAVKSLCSKTLWLTQGKVTDFADTAGVLRRYLSDEEQPSAWTSDGWTGQGLDSPHFAPRRFALVDPSLSPVRGTVGADDRIGVVIEGDVDAPHAALLLGFSVTAATGELLFSSQATDQTPERWPPITRGRNRLVGWIPPHLLNEGDYVVELVVLLHNAQWISEPGRNAPQLRLLVRGGLSESPYWMQPRPGLNAPVLEFEALPGSGQDAEVETIIETKGRRKET